MDGMVLANMLYQLLFLDTCAMFEPYPKLCMSLYSRDFWNMLGWFLSKPQLPAQEPTEAG